ncbi:MAG: MaoC family dehydratase N-terminal domain-containing protein [Austwickia sp.]|nr:MaoC family dehydratase N-terminal domain-containing protein [Actinomycetota bacterium]MCB1251986.1 MaoC family dehydratase N-terminal domain-containing protein [Austwickia sp.]MCO5310127.1 MaoC family dehydratase N-terminal domain-containing protein [Austwickia sp.]
MPVDVAFEGRSYPPSEPYAVGREAIRAFAAAVGAGSALHHDVAAARAAGYPDLVAPPTFAVVIAQRCEAQYVTDPAAGIDFTRVVHAEERFESAHPLIAGTEVVATLHVEKVRLVGGHGMVTTRVELSAADGAAAGSTALGQVTSMLVIRGTDE